MPFSLEIEPPPPEIREQAIGLAREVGLAEHTWDRSVAELDPIDRIRVRLARALALNPPIVLFEHASATVSRADVAPLGHDIRATLTRRGAAGVALTVDREFAAAVATRILTLEPATGRFTEGWLGKMKFWS
jgi:ABC-type histidine transport system ATPase subunit